MGFKLVCVSCRNSFSIGTDFTIEHTKNCRNCGKESHVLNQKFKPPKKKDKKRWQIVEFLIEKGFDFSSAYFPLADEKGKYIASLQVNYPQTMEDAKLFVQCFDKK